MKLLTLLMALTIGMTTTSVMADTRQPHDKELVAAGLFRKSHSADNDKSEKSDKAEKSEKKKEKVKKEPDSKAEPKTAEGKPSTKTAAAPIVVTKPSDPNDPTQLDSALMSVLRDMNKALKESDEPAKYEEPAQKAAVRAALEALDASLVKAAITPNRIVENEAKGLLERKLVAESWDSGDLKLSDGSDASLNVLWAKKVNGLVNISIAGNCGCHPNADGERVGEWVVVINGKSTLDTGFDIQTQSNVNFWLGKLNNVTVDATTCGEGVTSLQQVPVLKALKTDKRRKFEKAEALAAAKKSTSAGATAAGASTGGSVITAQAPTPHHQLQAADAEDKPVVEKKKPEVVEKPEAVKKPEIILPPAEPVIQKKAEAPVILDQVQLPSASAQILMPKRAIAGEYITVSVVDAGGKPEKFVELNFNEFKATTNAQGKVVFQVPEDSPPGPTLAVSLSARADSSPERVYILQPLVRPSSTDVPKIDRWSINREEGTITIEGHNFDGIAENNRVILDARHEATIRFSSPVELQAQLNLVPGGHDVIIQRNGIRSESISLAIPGGPPEAVASKNKKKS